MSLSGEVSTAEDSTVDNVKLCELIMIVPLLLSVFFPGEPYSQSLAKGLILVFFLIIATVLWHLGDKFERRGAL